jgi:hypothetical protein
MADNDNELDNYYVIKFENFIQLMKQTDSIYAVLKNLIKDIVDEIDVEEWEETAIPQLSGYLSVTHELKTYLDDIINNPTEKEVELTVKYDLKDVLITLEDLSAINIMLEAMQAYEVRLYDEHKITTIVQ